MHRLLFLFLVAQLVFVSCNKNKLPIENTEVLFNNDWEFVIDTLGLLTPDDIVEKKNILSWEKVQLPHTPRIEPKVVNNQWMGTCWYRKNIKYKPDWDGKKLFVRFEGAMNRAEVWVNGVKKIIHHGGYLPFVIDISDNLVPGQENDIYVRLNNEDSPVTGPKPLAERDFNMYGGLYRDVLLLVKDPVHISDEQFADIAAGGGVFVTYPHVSETLSTVAVRTHIQNLSEEKSVVGLHQKITREGIEIAWISAEIELEKGSDTTVYQEIKIDKPELWSPQNPALYGLSTTLMRHKSILETQNRRIGLRKFEFVDNKLFLNGNETFLRGVNRHQEYPYIGYALSNNANFRDAYKIKNAGFDYVRFSHYPHSKTFLDACDELGLVVIDAILGWQYYREYSPFRTYVLQASRDMIRRDRNHPSILAWEVSLNESWMPEDFIDSLTAIAKEEYPFEKCYTAGWQKYGYDIYLQARQHRLGHEADYGGKPYIVSEYGDWEYYAQNAGLNQDDWGDLLEVERTSRQELDDGEKRLLQQAKNIQEAHNDNSNTPAVADGYWVMFDYNRGYSNDLETSGIMSIFRLPKFSYYFYQSQRDAYEPFLDGTNSPMVYIASYFDNTSSDEIRVFSNCEEVELVLNDESLGIQKPDTGRISKNLNHPPFTFEIDMPKQGKLKANGLIDGEVVASYEVQTPRKLEKIILEADLSGRDWESGCKDGIFIYAKVVDKNNQTLAGYNGELAFTVDGDAIIVGNSNPKAEAGIATVLVIAGNNPGEIKISANSEQMISGSLTLSTKPTINN